MSNSSSSSSSGISFLGLLAIVFITLKLTGAIHWPWLWVVSPLWIPITLILLALVGYLLVMVVMTVLRKTK
ncbi:hypothetical protein JIN85_14865 [Luteolibacter pohnpeiensis]|uniref:Transmembrane Fragile-X-F protein n=1 Tax=Luteolibacter pohnpeiensis TaxID=454153 RepID=A0A934S7N3_9BACT|nr:hypothetical protein [Luteolibacter pohnpeiensis]